MSPRATNPPMISTPRKKEKSALVVKATTVRPAKSKPVMSPAAGITVGSLLT